MQEGKDANLLREDDGKEINEKKVRASHAEEEMPGLGFPRCEGKTSRSN